MAKKKNDELSQAERDAFLKSVTTGSSTSPEEARHLRGVAAALVASVVLFGGDFFVAWKYGGFDDAQSIGSGARGIAFFLMAQCAFIGWLYRALSARPQ